jgi:arylsulfatase A-like enzyme
MNRRTFMQSSLIGGESWMLLPGQSNTSGGPTNPQRHRNVIWIFGDQHRAQALSCAGDPNACTPNVDNLAELGVTFTNALSGFPLCCPFRGSLLTGRYPHHCVPGHEYPLPEGQPTIANMFNDAGYRTAYFGKWHLGGWHEFQGRGAMFITRPERRGGFETWIGYENNNSQWDSWVHGGSGKDAFHYRLPGYETDELTNLFIKYLRERGEEQKNGGKPFFAALSVQPPHDPYVAPGEFMRRYSGARLQLRSNVPRIRAVEEQARRELQGYYAMIENWDWNIGRIRQALDQSGLAFHTHIVFFSDHGDMHGSQGMFRKTNPFEESIRIPFVIAGEQTRYNGRRIGRVAPLLNHVDIAPTTLGLCGIGKPSWMEGTDYSHHRLEGNPETSEPDSAYLQNVVPTGHPDSINKPYRGLVTREGWKYICFEHGSWLMFDLNEDPYEQVNLAHNNRYRANRKQLADRLRQWVSDTQDKFGVPAE